MYLIDDWTVWRFYSQSRRDIKLSKLFQWTCFDRWTPSNETCRENEQHEWQYFKFI